MSFGKATRADVARRAEVSTAVVSYVINDGPRPVAAATRQRVLAAIEELGYRPNVLAQRLSGAGSQFLGLVLPDAANPFFSRLARAVERAAAEAGHLVIIGNSGFDAEVEERYLRTLAGLSPRAVILANSPGETDLDTLTRHLDCRTVLLHRRARHQRLPYVVSDNEQGGRLAAEHLIAHGYRDIACLGGPHRRVPVIDRQRGFITALRGAGVEPRDPISCQYHRQAALVATRELLRWSPRPRALFVVTDEQAVGALAAANRLGVNVPEELAIIAMDGLDDGAFTYPPLSTVRQDIDGLASAAVTMAVEPTSTDDGITLPVELLARSSCGCPQR